MNRLAAVLAGALAVGPAPAIEGVERLELDLPPDLAAACEADERGCVIMPHQAMQARLQRAFEAGRELCRGRRS